MRPGLRCVAAGIGLKLELLVVGKAVGIGIRSTAGDRRICQLGGGKMEGIPLGTFGEGSDGRLRGERSVESERVGNVIQWVTRMWIAVATTNLRMTEKCRRIPQMFNDFSCSALHP